MPLTRRLPALPAIFVLLPLAAWPQVNVLTANYDNLRTNSNLAETKLNHSTVGPGFGKLFSMPVDGQVYAQPLYVSGVTIPGQGVHNVLYVATMHNSVYAFDADPGGASAPFWSVSLGPPVPTANYPGRYGPYYTDITPESGVLSTPVIDLGSQTLYAVAATYDNGTYAYTLHALDLTTGAEKGGGPTPIRASVAGTAPDAQNGVVSFDPFQHLQRPGLLLSGGVVYVGFGSHGDSGIYHGWIVGYRTSDLTKPASVFNVTPNGEAGSIWQAGRGMAADDSGNIYAISANGDYDGQASFGESFLKFGPGLSLADWFTPANWADLNASDYDLGSSGPILLPQSNLMVGGSKNGMVYVVDRTQMGHLSAGPGPGGGVQSFQATHLLIFNLALWNRSDGPRLYLLGYGEPLKAYQMTGNQFNLTPMSQGTAVASGVPEQGMAISANGSDDSTGILWVTPWGGGGYLIPGSLHAYDASDLSNELWNSTVNPDDNLGYAAKFVSPTVANGYVYVPTFSNQVVVYGVKPAAPLVTASITVVNGASLLGGGVSPGEVVAIFSNDMAFAANQTGLSITFDGQPASVLYASPAFWTAIVPYSVLGKTFTNIAVETAAGLSAMATLPVAAANPGLFTPYGTGTGAGLILNQDQTPNSPSNPAAPGSVISIYATGVGQTQPANDDPNPIPAGGALPVPTLGLTVTVAGQPCEIIYAGATVGLVGAVTTIQVRLPAGLVEDGAAPVVLHVGDATSQVVTMAVS